MPDSMQTQAMERLRQMYSQAQPNTRSHTQPQHSSDTKNETNHADETPSHASDKNVKRVIHNSTKENLIDIIMRDKEKSLLVLLLVILLSEKADTTLVLSLLYLIL